MSFACLKCGVEFETNYLLQQHNNKKRPCVNKLPDIIPAKMCEFCGNLFACVSSKNTHIKTCKVRQNKNKIKALRDVDIKNNQINKLNNQLSKSQKCVKKLQNELKRERQFMRQENKKLQKIIDNKSIPDINYVSVYYQNYTTTINGVLYADTTAVTSRVVESMLDLYKCEAPIMLALWVYCGNNPKNHSLHMINRKTRAGEIYNEKTWRKIDSEELYRYCCHAYSISYSIIDKIYSSLDKYKNNNLIYDIRQNQADKGKLQYDVCKLRHLVGVFALETGITPDFIKDDIKRGRAALKSLDEFNGDTEHNAAEPDK